MKAIVMISIEDEREDSDGAIKAVAEAVANTARLFVPVASTGGYGPNYKYKVMRAPEYKALDPEKHKALDEILDDVARENPDAAKVEAARLRFAKLFPEG